MKTYYAPDEEVTLKERKLLSRLNQENVEDLDNFEKLISPGEYQRYESVREFLKNPRQMRKYLRKKKNGNPKSKRCKCR